MQKENLLNNLLGISGIIAIGLIIIADLFYKFGNYDTPFFLVFIILMFLVVKKIFTSKSIFIVSLVVLVAMGISYKQAGDIRLTERLGEWFFILFICGLSVATVASIPFSKVLDKIFYKK